MGLLRYLAGYAPVHLTMLLVGFGNVYAFTRLLGPEDYGLYALMLSLQMLIGTATLTWSEAAAFRFAGSAQAEGRMGAHIARSVSLLARSLGVTAIVVLALVGAFWNHPRYLAVLPWLALFIPARSVIQLSLELHRAEGAVQRYVWVYTSMTLGGFIIGVLVAALADPTARAPFIGTAAAAVMVAIVQFVWLISRTRGESKFAADHPARYFRFGAPVAMALLLDILLSAGDRFLLALFEGEEAVGAYAAGYGLADKTVLMLCAWAAMAAAPLLMQAWESEGPDAARREAHGLISVILLVGIPAAAGVALVAEPLATVMVDEGLREGAVRTIPWIALAGFFNGLLVYYWTEAFQLTRKSLKRALYMLVPTVFNLAANLILIPWLGLMGAVYATVASYLLGNVVMALGGRGLFAMPLPLDSAARVLLATAIMVAAVWWLPNPGGLLELALKAGVGILVYAAAAWWLDAGGVRDLIRARRTRSDPVPGT